LAERFGIGKPSVVTGDQPAKGLEDLSSEESACARMVGASAGFGVVEIALEVPVGLPGVVGQAAHASEVVAAERSRKNGRQVRDVELVSAMKTRSISNRLGGRSGRRR